MAINNDVTISVPEAGRRYFGLSRNAAYDAAARGELPVIRIGRLLRVPVRALDAMLEEARGRRKNETGSGANIAAARPAGLEAAQ
jgi:excisionase family DNA binding protein